MEILIKDQSGVNVLKQILTLRGRRKFYLFIPKNLFYMNKKARMKKDLGSCGVTTTFGY